MRELTALDLHYLIREWQFLQGSKVDQVYQPGKDILLRLHIPNEGKKIMRITKHFIFLADFKEEQGMPKGFCMALRKHIAGARIQSLSQVRFERVVHLEFAYNDVYIELFAKGNIIVVDKEMNVLASLNKLFDKVYTPPKRDQSIKELTKAQFKELLASSDEEVVKLLARDLGLSGFYAELILGEDKQRMANEYSAKEAEKLFEQIKSLLDRPLQSSKHPKRPLPFIYDNSEPLEESFANLIAEDVTNTLIKEEENRQLAEYNRDREKQENIIKAQKKTVRRLENQVKENQRKGELIYEQYGQLRTILDNLEEAKKKHSWKEIKEHLGNHKIIKKIDEKNGIVTLDLE